MPKQTHQINVYPPRPCTFAVLRLLAVLHALYQYVDPPCRFWVNNSSRMYLLEGAGELHRNYGLDVSGRCIGYSYSYGPRGHRLQLQLQTPRGPRPESQGPKGRVMRENN